MRIRVPADDDEAELTLQMDVNGATRKEIVNKILEYYSQVPKETKQKFDEIYKNDCTEWLHQVK